LTKALFSPILSTTPTRAPDEAIVNLLVHADDEAVMALEGKTG
jgi:hypothetical protein